MLRLEGTVGSIDVGKRADIVLVDGDPSVDITTLRRPRLVLRRGIAKTPDERLAIAPQTSDC